MKTPEIRGLVFKCNYPNCRIHPSSDIENEVQIGESTVIWRWVHIRSGAVIGKNCSIGNRVDIGPNVKIGDNVRIQSNVFIPEGVTIGNNVFIGPNVSFTNDRRPPSNKIDWGTIRVNDRASIGANAVILPYITLGYDCLVGAGSVVTKDVADSNTVAGNPARPLEKK